jgi:hypothetical protein
MLKKFDCREATTLKCARKSCLADEGRPLGIGFQELVSNRPGAAVVKSHGSERFGKRHGKTVSGEIMGDERK